MKDGLQENDLSVIAPVQPIPDPNPRKEFTANKNPYHFKERGKKLHLTNSKALVPSKDDNKYLLNSGSAGEISASKRRM